MFGSDLKSYLESAGYPVSGFNRSNIDLELTEEALAAKLEAFDVIVNTVAYTAVDRAEQEPDLANRINGECAGKLARVSALTGARFIHVSTDYVFDGSAGRPISPFEGLNPINSYGHSKALGESLVADSGADFVILRTAGLYGKNGNCFPRTIAKKLLAGESVSVVSDQFGQPTWTQDLAEIALAHSLNNFGERVVHAVSSGETSWYDFAVAISESAMKGQVAAIKPVESSEYQTPARRPAYSVLDNTKTQGPIIGNWLERWKVADPEILGSVQESL
jgi:dTDP-4-dehydrorhamnose reductase